MIVENPCLILQIFEMSDEETRVMRSGARASHDGSHVGWHLACSDEDPYSYQREDEDSSGDHKGEMHAPKERLLIPHQCSQDRNS